MCLFIKLPNDYVRVPDKFNGEIGHQGKKCKTLKVCGLPMELISTADMCVIFSGKKI